MRLIELTKRNGDKMTLSYEKVNAWLKRKARFMSVICYYSSSSQDAWNYRYVDGETLVPEERDGMTLVRIVVER